MLSLAVTRSCHGEVTKSRAKGAVLGVFFLTDNALNRIPFGTNTRTDEPIEMPLEDSSLTGTVCYVG